MKEAGPLTVDEKIPPMSHSLPVVVSCSEFWNFIILMTQFVEGYFLRESLIIYKILSLLTSEFKKTKVSKMCYY